MDVGLIERCAFGVHPTTVAAIIRTESQGNPLALHINALPRQPMAPTDRQHAARTAQVYIDGGYSVDMGLMQINSQHLARFMVTPSQAMEPCQNILIGTTILVENYRRAQQAGLAGDAAMRAALSAYNTGDFSRGERNGYVSRVLAGSDSRTQDAIAARSPARVEFLTQQEGGDMPKKSKPKTDAAIEQVRGITRKSSMVQIEVDPEVAEHMGAFEEDALTESDSIESLFDDEVGTDG